MTEANIKRVVIYLRISRDRETQTSITTQRYEIEEYCKKKGWEIVDVLADPGRSAYKKKTQRPEYEKAMMMIERKQVDAIVVWKLDRFSRSATEFSNALQRIENAGGNFVSVTESYFDTTNAAGRLMTNMVATFAEMESDMKRDRMLPMHAAHKRDGKVAPGVRSFGYDRVNSKDRTDEGKNRGAVLTINEDEAKVLRVAAERLVNGGTLPSVIRDFQPKSTQGGKALSLPGLRGALVNPTTAGLRTLPGSPDGFKKGCWEPILDRETWDAVRAILRDPKRKVATSNQISYLLSGILTCGKCGSGTTGRNSVHHRSKVRTQRYECRECKTSMPLIDAESIVTSALFDAIPQSKWESWQTSGMGWNPETILNIEAKLSAIDSEFAADKMTIDRWMTVSATLNAQLDAARNSEPLDIPQVANLAQSWGAMSLLDKRKVLKLAFRSIRLVPFAKGMSAADRLDIQPS